MIPLEKFLACVRENAARIHAYELGHDGSDGKSDCIGLMIGALKLAGVKWPGIHGSNWAARNAMDGLQYIPDASEMFPGEIVYKARDKGSPSYSLPDRYKDGPDLTDYYHVGVVTQINPLVITHCTSVPEPGGVREDGKIGNWRWGGKLKYVDYAAPSGGGVPGGGGEGMEEPDMEIPYQAVVTADTGSTVNLRVKPDKKGTIIAKVDIGKTVTVLDELGEWDKVNSGGKIGYMMTKFLRPLTDEDEPADGQDGDAVAVPRELLETWADVLEEMARDIREKLGQG